MNTEQILMCVVALILGMLLANMLKSVCGCKVVEGMAPGTCILDVEEFNAQYPQGGDVADVAGVVRSEMCRAQLDQAHCERLGQNLAGHHKWCKWQSNN